VLGDPVNIELERGVLRSFSLGGLGLGGSMKGARWGVGVGGRRWEEGIDEGAIRGGAELADDEPHLLDGVHG
jgi:hypothetical protein